MERRIRKDKDENQWERVVKRAAEGNKGIKRAVAKKVLRAYGRLSKRDVGSETKWGRVMKMAEDGEDEQFEEIEKKAGDDEDEDFEEDTLEEVLTNLSITLTWMIIDCKSYQVVSKAF